MKAEDSLAGLVSSLCKLPGVGRRTAERMARALARERDGLARELIHTLSNVCDTVAFCGRCGAMTTNGQDPCSLCTDPGRDDETLCVVEDASDIALMERAHCVQGRYHALLGKISPMRGQGPADIRLGALLRRVEAGTFKEVILALNTDVESEATCEYIAGLLRERGVSVSRLALGIPAGSGIAYADPVTLERSVRGRHRM